MLLYAHKYVCIIIIIIIIIITIIIITSDSITITTADMDKLHLTGSKKDNINNSIIAILTCFDDAKTTGSGIIRAVGAVKVHQTL